jgi:hypothetical protein
MKTILKIAVLTPALILLFLVDVPPEVPLQVQLVPEAQAIFGVRRRAWRRGVVVGASVATAGAEEKQAAAAKQQAAAAQQQAAAAHPPAAAAPPPAAAGHPPAAAAPAPAVAAAAAGKPLPLGTVVPSLPGGCTSTPVGGVEYYYCAGNFYRAVFQGNNLVYVTAQP